MKKLATKYPGVRYREHKTRRFSGQPDRYFTIRYRVDGKPKEEGVGWASNGMNAVQASMILADLKKGV